MSSTTAGYLRPSTEIVAPVEDDALDAILQQAIVGITGLAGQMVRPLWQQIPPTEPPIGTDWAAVGVTLEDPESNAVIIHHGTGAVGESDSDKAGPLPGGWDEMQRHEVTTILASFYGPNARKNAHLLRDGLYLDQNKAMLTEQGLGLIDSDEVRNVPDLLNQQWRKRADFRFRLYKLTTRAYPVRNINEASGTIVSDTPSRSQEWDTDNIKTEEN